MKKIIIAYSLIFVLVVNLVLAFSVTDLVGFNIFEKPPKRECMHSCKETAKTAEQQCKTKEKAEAKPCLKEAKSDYKTCKTCCNDAWKGCKEEAKQAKDACKESGKSTKECSYLAKEVTNNCEFNCNATAPPQQCADPCFVNPPVCDISTC